MSVALTTVMGDSLVFEVEFFTDTAGTVPWDDVGLFAPLLQVRLSTSSPETAASVEPVVVDNVATFSIPSATTSEWGSCTYYWDVQFIDPEADEGLGVFTWPGAGEDRNTLEVTADITKILAP